MGYLWDTGLNRPEPTRKPTSGGKVGSHLRRPNRIANLQPLWAAQEVARFRDVLLRSEMFCVRIGGARFFGQMSVHRPRKAATAPYQVFACASCSAQCRARLCAHLQRAGLRLCPFSFSLQTVLRAALRHVQGTAAKCVTALRRLCAAALVAAPLVAPVPPLANGAAPHPAQRGRSALKGSAIGNRRARPSKKLRRKRRGKARQAPLTLSMVE